MLYKASFYLIQTDKEPCLPFLLTACYRFLIILFIFSVWEVDISSDLFYFIGPALSFKLLVFKFQDWFVWCDMLGISQYYTVGMWHFPFTSLLYLFYLYVQFVSFLYSQEILVSDHMIMIFVMTTVSYFCEILVSFGMIRIWINSCRSLNLLVQWSSCNYHLTLRQDIAEAMVLFKWVYNIGLWVFIILIYWYVIWLPSLHNWNMQKQLKV